MSYPHFIIHNFISWFIDYIRRIDLVCIRIGYCTYERKHYSCTNASTNT